MAVIHVYLDRTNYLKFLTEAERMQTSEGKLAAEILKNYIRFIEKEREGST